MRDSQMTNYQISKEIRFYKSLGSAAKATSNQAEWQRCNAIVELLEEQLSITGAGRHV